MINILAVTDLFVTSEVWSEALKTSIKQEIDINDVTSNWPIDPLTHNQEISEFYPNVTDKILMNIKDADVLVTQAGPVSEEIINSGENLKVIGCARGGAVNVNLDAATRQEIPVVNAPGRNKEGVAEFTLGLIFSEIRDISRAHSDLAKEKIWRGDFYSFSKSGFELKDKSALIVGYGNIGARVAELLYMLSMEVYVYDPFLDEEKVKNNDIKVLGNLDKGISQADIITLHARHSDDTHHMFGKQEFSKMSRNTYFINTARGGLVDQKALVEALEEEKIAGAALDVYETEPVEHEDKLFELNNVTLTPHIAGATKETARRSALYVSREIENYFKGQPVENCLNPETLEGIS